MSDDEATERAYIDGWRAATRSMLQHLLTELEYDLSDPVQALAAKHLQLDAARAMLRKVCEQHGDNDWPDNLNLADAIEKHLWRHLGQ